MIKVFHIRESRLVDSSGASMVFSRKRRRGAKTHIPKSQIVSFEPYKKEAPHIGTIESWIKVSVTTWIWNKAKLEDQFRSMVANGEVILEGDNQFRIDWDEVRRRSSKKDHCFFCLRPLLVSSRTKDHLISRHILKKNNINALPHNTVPCCTGCNGLKGSLHPEEFRKKVSLKIHQTGLVYYSTIKECLDDIINS